MKTILLGTCAALAVIGCGGNLHSIWLVSVTPTAKPSSCYPKGVVPTKTTTLKDTQQSAGNWEIYEGPDSKFYLARALSPHTVIEGSFKDNVYTFDSIVTTETKNSAENPTQTITQVSQNTFDLRINGTAMSGNWTAKYTSKCEGTACKSDFKDIDPDCSVTSPLRGRKLEAVIQHNI
jgi:hypothetical protein